MSKKAKSSAKNQQRLLLGDYSPARTEPSNKTCPDCGAALSAHILAGHAIGYQCAEHGKLSAAYIMFKNSALGKRHNTLRRND